MNGVSNQKRKGARRRSDADLAAISVTEGDPDGANGNPSVSPAPAPPKPATQLDTQRAAEPMRPLPGYEDLSEQDFKKRYPTAGTMQPKPIPLALSEEKRRRLDQTWTAYFGSYTAMKVAARDLYRAGQTYDAMKLGCGQAVSAQDQNRQHRDVQNLELAYAQQCQVRNAEWETLREAILDVGREDAGKHFTERRMAANKKLGFYRNQIKKISLGESDALSLQVLMETATADQKKRHHFLHHEMAGLAEKVDKVERESGPLSEAERLCAETKFHEGADPFDIHVKV